MNADSSDPRLVVVQAPAGCGKTTLLRELAQRADLPLAWIDVTPADNDPIELAQTLVDALSSAVGRVLPRPDEPHSLRMTWVPEFTNALRDLATGDVLLVIDGLERLTGEAANELLEWVLDAFGPALRVLIGSRRKPRLRLARRLASGDAVILGPLELELDGGAISAAVARAGGAELEGDEVATLQLWSRGWPVAVEFAARAWAANHPARSQARNPEGPDLSELLGEVAGGPLADYVEQNMLSDLSAGERVLLLAMAAIERASIELAGALAGHDDGRRLIRALCDDHGLVVTLDGAGEWLAVHPALRAPLVALLERTGQEAEREVKVRAGAWFEGRGMIGEAIEQAAAIDDGDEVARLLCANAIALVSQRHLDTLRVALSSATPTLVPDGLRDVLGLIVAAAEGRNVQGMVAQLDAITIEHGDDPDIGAIAALLLASPSRGDIPAAIDAASAVLERLPTAHQLHGYILSLLGLSLLLDGQIPRARALLQPVIGSDGPVPRLANAYSVLALAAVVEGDTQLAERYGHAAVELCVDLGELTPTYSGFAHAALADALRQAGKLALARETLEEAQTMVWRGTLRHGLILVIDARLALAERRRGAARLSADRAREVLSGFANPGAGVLAWLTAIDAALEQKVDDAHAGSMPSPAELRVLKALFTHSSRNQIAQQLFLSEQTVKSHLRRLYRRLGVNNREDALAAARARGLGPDE